MRHKLKMELINNYVDIFKVLYSCKYLIKNANALDSQITEKTSILEITNHTLKLKEDYEKSFHKLKIDDSSFLLLKKELEEGLNYPFSDNYTPVNLNKINEANTKIYKKLVDTSFKYKLNI